jgi:hypothetical protein
MHIIDRINYPAFPVADNDANYGMSLIQYFCAHAPEDIPGWYQHEPPPKNLPPLPSLSEITDLQDQDEVRQWERDPIFDLQEHLKWYSDKFETHYEAVARYNAENIQARYFQWRFYYAKEMLNVIHQQIRK